MNWPNFIVPKLSVDLWSISLDEPVGENEWNILESSEQERAQRFHRKIDRDRFVICRSSLRRTLGAYLDRAPERLKFEYGRHGKPLLAGEDLHFNVAHAEDKSLIAITCAGPVGVDLEPEARILDVDGFTRIACSPAERARIVSLPFAERRSALLRIWVAKEAFLKSTGEGLTRSLSALNACDLTVRFIDAIPDFISAIALPSSRLPVQIFPNFALIEHPIGRALGR
jgi:4'-phosphopantetheinyl transferase